MRKTLLLPIGHYFEAPVSLLLFSSSWCLWSLFSDFPPVDRFKINLWFISSLHICVSFFCLLLQNKTFFSFPRTISGVITYWKVPPILSETTNRAEAVKQTYKQGCGPQSVWGQRKRKTQEGKNTAASSVRWEESRPPSPQNRNQNIKFKPYEIIMRLNVLKVASTADFRDFFHYPEGPKNYKPHSFKV